MCVCVCGGGGGYLESGHSYIMYSVCVVRGVDGGEGGLLQAQQWVSLTKPRQFIGGGRLSTEN